MKTPNEPKVGECGLSDEELAKDIGNYLPPLPKERYWFTDEEIASPLSAGEYQETKILGRLEFMTSGEKYALYRAVIETAKRKNLIQLVEAKPEPLPNTQKCDCGHDWQEHLKEGCLHRASLDEGGGVCLCQRAPNTRREERIEALLQVVREYRENHRGKNMCKVYRNDDDMTCNICIKADALLVAPKVVDSKEEPHCEHGIAWRLCSMHPGSWIGPNNEDAGEEQDGEQELPALDVTDEEWQAEHER